jgi:hypothetical protein
MLRKLDMFIKPESRVLRALFWVLVVLVPGGFLLLALLGANVLHRRMRQESAALAPSEAKALSGDASKAEASERCAAGERPSQTAPTHAALSPAALSHGAAAPSEACESIVPVSRIAA